MSICRHGPMLIATAICWLALPTWVTSGPSPGAIRLEASILRVRPAVVLISSQVNAEVTLRCGSGPAQTVQPDPYYETGSGFVIHPDGYIATNGHVVTASYEKRNDPTLVDDFVHTAVQKACGPGLARLPDRIRTARLAALAADPRNRGQVQLTADLEVHLSNGQTFPAEVMAYSPALNPDAPARIARQDMGPMDRFGKDVALLKIAATDLPTVPLALNSQGVLIGEPLFVIGYPGVVLNHDFLSKQSALDASVTVGRVSGFKTDITNRRVIQTDAAITWGDSGGPAFGPGGKVIGVATFISTTLDGDQAIQGFNFLIPVETVQEFARTINLTPTADSPFARAWDQAVHSFFQQDYRRTLQAVEAAERIRPGFMDVAQLGVKARVRMQAAGPGGLARRLGISLMSGLGLGLLVLGIWWVARRRRGVMPRLAHEDIRSEETASSDRE